ncbi:MAG: RidA family protein [Candidatus Zixiibacteriota bacterium]
MKQIVKTDKAPSAIGPYSQAIKVTCGEMLFVSGQIPLDPVSGQIVGAGAADQARRAMDNLIAVIQAGGATADQIVKATIFLKDMNDFAAVNEVYSNYFDAFPPARACVEVSRLPKDVLVEIEAIAIC